MNPYVIRHRDNDLVFSCAKDFDFWKIPNEEFGDINKAKTIYIASRMLKNNVQRLKKLKHKYVLISASDDRSATDFLSPVELQNLLSCKNLVAFFVENLNIEHPKIFCLPTGLYNDGVALRYLEKEGEKSPEPKKKKFKIYCQYRDTHEDRKRATKFAKNSSLCEFKPHITLTNENSHMRFETLEKLKQHAFTLCPRGAGIDTHRLFEAICLKSIPIVKSSTIDSIHKMMPVIVVKKWEDINQEMLKQNLNYLNNKFKQVPKCATKEFWLDHIKSKL